MLSFRLLYDNSLPRFNTVIQIVNFSDLIEFDFPSERPPQNFEPTHSEDTVITSRKIDSTMEINPPIPTGLITDTGVESTSIDITVAPPPRKDHYSRLV